MIGKASVADWLETAWILRHFGRRRKEAIKRYVEFVSAGKGMAPVWDEKIHASILGDEQFIESVYREYVEEATAEIAEISRMERQWSSSTLESYYDKDADRPTSIRRCYRDGGYTMKEIADYCGVHYSTISRIIRSQ